MIASQMADPRPLRIMWPRVGYRTGGIFAHPDVQTHNDHPGVAFLFTADPNAGEIVHLQDPLGGRYVPGFLAALEKKFKEKPKEASS